MGLYEMFECDKRSYVMNDRISDKSTVMSDNLMIAIELVLIALDIVRCRDGMRCSLVRSYAMSDCV